MKRTHVEGPPGPLHPHSEPEGRAGLLMKLDALLEPLPSSTVERSAIVTILGFAAIDIALGPDLSFSFFYLLPIGVTAWYGKERAGYFLALLASAVWLGAEFLSGVTYATTGLLAWNLGVRVGTFLVVTALAVRLRTSLDTQRELAHSDSLTGLANAREFVGRMEDEIERAERYGRVFTLAYFDLDHFKEVNDSLGHAVGDDVLIAVARTMQRTMRTTDICARLGGDEFAVLLPETPFAQAEWALGKLRKEILEEMAARGWPVTLSMGAVTFESPARSPEEAIRIADRLMYQVKDEGRDAILHLLWTGEEHTDPAAKRDR